VALGGNGPGVLREFAVFEDKFLVKLPQHLSWEEVSRVLRVVWVVMSSELLIWTGINARVCGTDSLDVARFAQRLQRGHCRTVTR
jgi:hypothetical protein